MLPKLKQSLRKPILLRLRDILREVSIGDATMFKI